MNAVRMSHYPPDEHFLDACDELGLYVLDELAGWQKPPYDTEIGKKLVKEMVTRDVCHPCILFWDNGNEGGWNRELDDQFALYDPQKRTVLHPWENFGGIDTDHYENYDSTQKKLSGSTLFMPTEFLHGLYDGGHGAGLDDYWNLTLASPMGAGGFLWALVDEGVVRTDKNGADRRRRQHGPGRHRRPVPPEGGQLLHDQGDLVADPHRDGAAAGGLRRRARGREPLRLHEPAGLSLRRGAGELPGPERRDRRTHGALRRVPSRSGCDAAPAGHACVWTCPQTGAMPMCSI